MLPICTKKHSDAFFIWSNLQKCRVQLVRPSAFATRAPCPWKTNRQPIKASTPSILSNSQCQYTVLRYWQGLSLISSLWWAQAPGKWPQTQKIVSFLMFWHSKLLFTTLIRLWRTWSRDGLLCVIIHACHSSLPFFVFGDIKVIKHPPSSGSSTLFSNISNCRAPLKVAFW